MRIAVLIIGLLLGAVMFIQTFLVNVLGQAAEQENTEQAGAVGLGMAFLWLVACGVVLPLPLVSVVLFVVAGIFGFAASGEFPDLAYWGGISFILAGMSLIGWFGKRRDRRKSEVEQARQRERDERLEHLMIHGAPARQADDPTDLQARQSAIANLEPGIRTAVEKVMPSGEAVRFVVLGVNATLVGTSQSLIFVPASKKKGIQIPIVTPYKGIANPRIEPTRHGGTLRYDVQSETIAVNLMNRQMGSGTHAVEVLREPPRSTAVPAELPSTTSQRHCTECGTRNDVAAKFCEACGHNLKFQIA